MILRRLTQHVKDQNWLAVWLDFLIVVLGVFIGIQVSNWNADRVTRQEEAQWIERLTVEFTAMQKKNAPRRDKVMIYARRTGALIDLIRAGELPEDEAEVRLYLDAAWSNMGVMSMSSTFQELINSGSLAKIESPGLRSALTRYGQVLDTTSEVWNTMFPQFNDPRSVFRHAVRFNTDLDVLLEADPQMYIVSYDWALLKEGEAEFENIYSMLAQQLMAMSMVQEAIDQVVVELAEAQNKVQQKGLEKGTEN